MKRCLSPSNTITGSELINSWIPWSDYRQDNQRQILSRMWHFIAQVTSPY
uniref:Uncharacterized protein n=1 Tax=Arundo donax TaxID=35708 RepID=A0A0A8Y7M4_ARUDO